MKDSETIDSFLSQCWYQDRLYLTVWSGTLIVIGGLLIASRAYPDGSTDPELMNLWIVWSIILVLVSLLTDDLRFVVGIQFILVVWLTIRLRFNRITFGRFLLVIAVLLLLISQTSVPRFLIFLVGASYLWQHRRFSTNLPVCSIGGQIPQLNQSHDTETDYEVDSSCTSETVDTTTCFWDS